jgi:hypothetical protein
LDHTLRSVPDDKMMPGQKIGRRGVVDVQFNWIFVLIAGFVIFLFIISIIFSQKNASEKQTSISAMNQITTILKSKQQTGDVYSETSIPSTTMDFTCDADTLLFNYKISGGVRTDLPTVILFTAPEVTTNKLLMWSQPFSTGFPVSVLTYLTTSDTIFVIYSSETSNPSNDPDSESARGYALSIYSDIPGNMTRKITSDISKYQKYEHKRLICIDQDCQALLSSGNLDFLMISPGADGIYAYGNVTFYKNGVIDQRLPYITKAGLMGAIFSYSPNYYYCQMTRALGQFEIKRTLMEKRLELMDEEIADTNCKTTMEVALDRAIKPMKNPALNWENVTFMNDNMAKLESWNTDLMLSSCPKMY